MAESSLIKSTEAVGYYHPVSVRCSSMLPLHKNRKMHGVKRVITFCLLIVILPATLIIIPLYLRHSVFADVVYPVAESDIIEIRDGISSVFCQQHSLHMDTNFNAFQLRSRPEISTNRKHIRLKKSMTLPDDTLEYWGFYLLKGAIVELKVCSRWDGSRILVVKGERNLETCGLLEHNKNKVGAHFAQGHEKVQVTFETVAEIVVSEEQQQQQHQQQNQNDNKNQINHSHSAAFTVVHNKTKKEIWNDEWENHAKEDLSEYQNDGFVVVNNTLMDDQMVSNGKPLSSSSSSSSSPVVTQAFLNAINHNNKTDPNYSNHSTLGKFHETDAQRNAIINNRNDGNIDGNDHHHHHHHRPHQKIRHRRHYIRNDRRNDNDHRNLKDDQRNRNDHRNGKMKRSKAFAKKKQKIYEDLYGMEASHRRYKRDQVYDRKISHGGNALNFTEVESGSISSFENSLLTCYDGQILLAQGFPPSSLCTSVKYLESGTHMISRHEVVEDGYYYYIFYSDNDLVRNDIHAVFDIYKPTFQYSNITDTKTCLNGTNCTFPISFLTDEIVVVEVPTRDGIEHDEDDITYLISTCHPRMSVYVIFPISVLFLILSCAFM